MHKLSSAVPEMKQGLISVGICCNQMKYGTVSVEKGMCQTFPVQHRGEVKGGCPGPPGPSGWERSLEGVAVQPGQGVCFEGRVLRGLAHTVGHIPLQQPGSWPQLEKRPQGCSLVH